MGGLSQEPGLKAIAVVSDTPGTRSMSATLSVSMIGTTYLTFVKSFFLLYKMRCNGSCLIGQLLQYVAFQEALDRITNWKVQLVV